MLQYACENCGQTLEAEEHQIGQKAKCPACGHVGVVPGGPRREAVQEERGRPVFPEEGRRGERDRDRGRDEERNRGRDRYRDDFEDERPRAKSSATPIILIVVGVLAVLLIGVVGIVVGLLLPAVSKVREASARMQTTNHMKQVGLAMHNFHDTFGGFPMATGYQTKDGKPGLSWRVALLPYLEHDNLHRQFKLDEPWDSPHNKALIPRMPKVYMVVGADPSNAEGLTHFQVIKGRNFLFDDKYAGKKQLPPFGLMGRPMLDIPDGTSNTLMVALVKTPVVWTKPDDLDADDGAPIGPRLDDRYRVSMLLLADGSVRSQRQALTEAEWKALLSANGGDFAPLD